MAMAAKVNGYDKFLNSSNITIAIQIGKTSYANHNQMAKY
jgi:hypothetical protein